MNPILQYLKALSRRHKTGLAREHSYRADLQKLIEAVVPEVLVINEPERVHCGSPDLVLLENNIAVGYVEAKDIAVDLSHKSYAEQFNRYKQGLPNLIITDYLEFRFFRHGELYEQISIAYLDDQKIKHQPENFERLENLIRDFSSRITQSIKSPDRLAKLMASKALLMADVIKKSLDRDDELERHSQLKRQLLSFKRMLISDIDNQAFSDIYAQTIAYGMFAARYHDPSLDDFSRTEAATLIPKSNPFLRKLFQEIAGFDLDDRLVWIVDELVSVFLASDVASIMQDFGKKTRQEDPVVHFYETFLGEYNNDVKKARGVWYTPAPIVQFIVRAVDDVLKKDFGISSGLADSSKTRANVKTDNIDKRTKSGYRQGQIATHKVQVLDPAVGTGTFLIEVIKHIHRQFKDQQGVWNQYVSTELIPRLNGFEILMASYAMAHLKIDMLLSETGYSSESDQRLNVFLTNSLEEASEDPVDLFTDWLAQEASLANAVKRETPVMCILGNPPYSKFSSNDSKWIAGLIEDYKYIGGVHFGEKKHWLNDDYVKFIRYGQYFIEKNGEGVLAFINPHGFLDSITFRGMRWHLLKAFDKIYTIDLHGNSNYNETSLGGGVDENVFDIKQGVSINIFIKTGKKNADDLGKVFHADVYGKRELKYDFLQANSLSTIDFQEVPAARPYYFFVPKDFAYLEAYENGFKVNDIFILNSSGCVTANDTLNVSMTESEQRGKIRDLLNLEESVWRSQYKRPRDSRDWTYKTAKLDADRNSDEGNIVQINYRPFDVRWTCYTGNSRGLYSSPQVSVMEHLQSGENVGLVVGRQAYGLGSMPWDVVFISNNVTDFNIYKRGGGTVCPLYLTPKNAGQQSFEDASDRTPNLKAEIVQRIAEQLGLTFTNEKESGESTFAPIDVLDYIYAVLHSPTYRKEYHEFLKIDFPKIPYPKDCKSFWELVTLGGMLRQTHLFSSPKLNDFKTSFSVNGDNVVGKRSFKNGKVYINATQYFDNVPKVAWEFLIGGYQPAQQWLKSRKDKQLSVEDIQHFQKIIVALEETDTLMKLIDNVSVV